jgi:SAM-dependent methyltransferase/uncharacterized protein YbaR (Trm112 family)
MARQPIQERNGIRSTAGPEDHRGMRAKLLQWIVCPSCGQKLLPDSLSGDGDWIEEGFLACPDRHVFPVVEGVPRLMSRPMLESLRVHYPTFFRRHSGICGMSYSQEDGEQKKKEMTSRRFGYEWTRFADYECDNFSAFLSPLPPDVLRGKLCLDAGCGAGRHAGQAARLGAEVIAVDLSQAVDVACRRHRDHKNIHVIQADIYHLPFERGLFQFVYSLGVLQHLPDPEGGFQNLTTHLGQGGMILAWVYAYSIRKRMLELLRLFSLRLSNEGIRRMAYLCNLVDYGVVVNAYRLLGAAAFTNRMAASFPPRIREYAGHGFRVSYVDWYDRLSAPITHYYREEEMNGWLARCDLQETALRKFEDSWWWLYGRRL